MAKKSAATKATKAAPKQDVKTGGPGPKAGMSTKELTQVTERVERAEAKTRRLERQVEKLKALDKVGVGRRMGGFVNFIREQGVVGFAVGLVLGGAVAAMVKSFIDNVVMPPLGFLLGSANGLKGLSANLGKTADGKEAVLNYGIFLNDFVNFLIIALVIYLVIHVAGLDKIFDKKKES